jgi:hypothetical protein
MNHAMHNGVEGFPFYRFLRITLLLSLPGCNAWTYCNNPNGCGGRCDNAVYGYKEGDLPDGLATLYPDEWPNKLNNVHKCHSDGAWPMGTCSLKYVLPRNIKPNVVPLKAGAEARQAKFGFRHP